MYQSIHLADEVFNSYKVENELRELTDLSRVNIFIGPNNSGKSRFLRGLFVCENLEYTIKGIDLKKFNHFIESFKTSLVEELKLKDLSKIGVHLEKLNTDKNYHDNAYNIIKEKYEEMRRFAEISTDQIKNYVDWNNNGKRGSDTANIIRGLAENCLYDIDHLGYQNYNYEVFARENIYVPVLRGLRRTNFETKSQDVYRSVSFDNYSHRTKQDYFKGKKVEDKIYTGLGLYEDVKRLLLGISGERQKVRDFETFLSKVFFENREVSIVPHIDDDVVYVKIGDDEDRPIYSLGEGIQAIIILTYPLFFNKGKNMNIFFEEPDLYLHPGFQRIFMETLNDEQFSSFQYFFTTHSNHFLDMTLDYGSTSVYAFHKDSKNEFSIRSIKSADKDILQALGARNSSVFLSNCTIWVEGITDRIYLRKYLELFMAEKDKKNERLFREDIHYSFVEYGGNNITHWSFLESEDQDHKNIDVQSLCGTLFLITDSDGAEQGSKKWERQKQLSERLKENYYCLQCREMENLLTPQPIRKAIESFEGKEYEEAVFETLFKSEYSTEKLGAYIDNNIKNLRKKYAAESGTVANKVQFAKNVVKHLNDYDDLSGEAKSLTEQLYDFILRNNRG